MAHRALTARRRTPQPEHQEHSQLSWETTVEGPPGSRDPSPCQLAQGLWALSRTDEHPSPVMPTDSSALMDTLDICPHCLGPAAANTLLQCPPGLGGKGGHAGDTGEPTETPQPDVHLQQREGTGRDIPLCCTRPGGTATFPLHSSGSPGCGAGDSRIPQELTLPVPEALGAMAAPSGPAAVLDEPHLPITPIFPSHPHGATS